MTMENKNVLTSGTLLREGRYRIELHLGSGGFGNTYQATEVSTGKLRALKEFYLKGVNERDADSKTVSVSNADSKAEFENQKAKFRKEAMRLINLQHPNVVRVYDLFEENGTAYYVMDYLDGQSLSAQMKAMGRPFTESETIAVARQLLDALDAVHSHNIWHLDLKPGNVMTAADGRVVLIDFGASKQFHDNDGHSLSTSTGLCYTPGYAPTEQIAAETNRLGPWTDVYALGATMYNLLTSQTPPSVSAIQDGEGFDFPPTASADIQYVIRRMMEPNRKRRPQSVAEVRRLMETRGLLEAPDQSAETQIGDATRLGGGSYDEDDDNTKGRRRWLVASIAALLAAILGISLFFLLSDHKTKRHSRNYDYDDDEEEYYEDEEDEEEAAEEWGDTYALDSIEMAMDVADTVAEPAKPETTDRRPAVNNDQPAVRREEPATPDNNISNDDEEEDIVSEPHIVNTLPEDRVMDVVEQQPQFPGGTPALINFLSQNIKYPAVCEANGIQGRVVCTFIVERDGSISNVTVARSVDPALDKEAVRVIESMPRWTPGMKDGEPVRVKYTLPISFRLQ